MQPIKQACKCRPCTTTERHCFICLGFVHKKIWTSTSAKQTGDVSSGLSSSTVTLMFCSLELHHQVVPPEQNTDRWGGDVVVVGVPRNDIQYVCPLLVTTAPDRHSPLCVGVYGRTDAWEGREEKRKEGKN